MNLNDQEVSTILAALRQRQAVVESATEAPAAEELEDIATNGGTLEALGSAEIDDLCERLNFAPKDAAGTLAGLLGEAVEILDVVAHPERGDDPAQLGPDALKLVKRIQKALRKARKAATS